MNTEIRRKVFVVLMSSAVTLLRPQRIQFKLSRLCTGLCRSLRQTSAAQANRGPAARIHSCYLTLLRKCTYLFNATNFTQCGLLIMLQEKRFNPYYILVGQQLCRISKSHQFTLQYCLWDFLRDLGETTVGGAEILKNMKDDEGNFELKRISETRCSNIARAYGWWIAKDCCSLTMLKVRPL